MRPFVYLSTALVLACGSTSGRATVETTIPTLVEPTVSPSAETHVDETPPQPVVVAPEVTPEGSADSAPPADSGLADICAIDPSVCKPMSAQEIASCRCNHLKGRDAQKCLIDCVARERNRVDQQLKQLGP